jgi:hypothetical protein
VSDQTTVIPINGDAVIAQLQAIRAGAQATIHQVDGLLIQLGVAQESPGGVVNDASEFTSPATQWPARFGRGPGE